MSLQSSRQWALLPINRKIEKCDSASFHLYPRFEFALGKRLRECLVVSPAAWGFFRYRNILLLRWLVCAPQRTLRKSLTNLSYCFPGDVLIPNASRCFCFWGFFPNLCMIACCGIALFISVDFLDSSFHFRIFRASEMASDGKTEKDGSGDSPTSVLSDEVCSVFFGLRDFFIFFKECEAFLFYLFHFVYRFGPCFVYF